MLMNVVVYGGVGQKIINSLFPSPPIQDIMCLLSF